jgi:hypothetical protein
MEQVSHVACLVVLLEETPKDWRPRGQDQFVHFVVLATGNFESEVGEFAGPNEPFTRQRVGKAV